MDLKSAAQRQQVIAFLQVDTLKHIILLKMLAAYAEASRCYYCQLSGAAGVLVLLPVRASPFDRQLYPAADYVVLLASTGADVAQALLDHVPVEGSLIFS